MSRPIPKDPNRVTIQEKFALDTGGTVTGGGETPKEVLEYIKEYEAEEAKRAEEAAKNGAVPNPEENSAPEQQ